MDVWASFQFLVDALRGERVVVAPDWRGFGVTASPAGVRQLLVPDYLGDLDALLDALSPGSARGSGRPQPGRERRDDLTPPSGPTARATPGEPRRLRPAAAAAGAGARAPTRAGSTSWRAPQPPRPYATSTRWPTRLHQEQPASPHRPRQLAGRTLGPNGCDDGQWHILGDPAHKRVNPALYRKLDEVLEGW